MDDPVLYDVLSKLSDWELNRALASSARAGDHDLTAAINSRLRTLRAGPSQDVAARPA